MGSCVLYGVNRCRGVPIMTKTYKIEGEDKELRFSTSLSSGSQNRRLDRMILSFTAQEAMAHLDIHQDPSCLLCVTTANAIGAS